MIVHVEKDLVNWGPNWGALRESVESQNSTVRELLAGKALLRVDLRDSLAVALFDEVQVAEVTLLCPDREDIYIFEGTPDEVRTKVGI